MKSSFDLFSCFFYEDTSILFVICLLPNEFSNNRSDVAEEG